MRKKVLSLLLAAAMGAGLTACGGSAQSEPAKTEAETKTEAPKAESTEAGTPAAESKTAEEGEKRDDLKLTIYSAVFEDQTQATIKAFEEATGVKTQCVVLGGGEILARVRAEKDNATASIWWGGPCDSHITGKEEGLLAQYNSPNAEQIEAKYKDPDGYWVGTYIGYVGFVSNVDRCKELGIDPPKSWADLLDPKLKGEIEMASPTASSTGYVILASILQLMGEEKGWDYAKALDENVFQYTERGSGCINDVKIGEVAVGICFAHDAIKNQLEGFEDLLVVTTPSEGTGYETGAMAILKDGPDQEAARMFYDWALTPEAQEIGQQYGAFQFLTAPGAKNPKETEQISDAKTITYDTAWAGSHKEEFQTKWADMTGR